MLRPVVVLLALTSCSFDASGLGQTPQAGTSSGVEVTATTAPGATTEPDATVTTTTTGEVSGSGSMTDGTSGPGGDPTTNPATTMEPDTTTAPDTTTEPCPMVMAYQDFDNDGHGDPNMPAMVCEGTQSWVPDNTDCNDMSANAHPGLTEVCDTIDNDCDGVFDEYDAVSNSQSCLGCDFKLREGRLYYFCAPKKDWGAAQELCKGHGLDLVKDDGGAEHTWLVQQIGDSGGWWIGGNDKSSEGNFVWVSDNSPVPKPGEWGQGEPNGQNWVPFEGADCALLIDANGDLAYFGAGGAWNDHKCDSGEHFICEGPQP